MMPMFLHLLKFLLMVIPVLLAVAFLTLAESKMLGYMQSRKGPNMVGLYGLLQPLADGAKLFSKEMVMPNHSNLLLYFFSPVLFLLLALTMWTVFPYNSSIFLSDVNLGMLFMFVISSISMYAILMSGWASSSKYAFIGSLSAAAQMMSYEVSMGLMFMSVLLCAGSLNMTKIVVNQMNSTIFMIPLFPMAMMFLMSALAETNSAPFDLTEGESELVSGYNVEYSSMSFALLFLAEYANMMFMSALFSLLFLGGWKGFIMNSIMWVGMKTAMISFTFIWTSASFPRISYDQLMMLLWKSYLPFSLAFVMLLAGYLWASAGLPSL